MIQNINDKKIKVCIVTISLSKGGAERSTALLSRMLYNTGFEVHLVTLNDSIDYQYSGKLINLGKNKPKNETLFKRFSRFKRFRQLIKKENFDFIIDNRNRQFALKELFYQNYIYRGSNVIYVVRSFNFSEYFPINTFVRKQMISKSKGIVGVSKEIASTINKEYNTQKAVCIYNPIEEFIENGNDIEFENPFVLFLGRIEESVKNLTLLLESYKLSNLTDHQVMLKIVGDGPDKNWLIKKIEELELTDYVEIISFTPHVYPYLKNAKFLCLTSKYEGFPRVLIESLSVSTPVVSVNCKSGPKEIVKNEFNGLLVENNNSEKLAEAFNRFLLDEDLYLHCKQNSKESINHLSIKAIENKWENYLLNEL